MKHSKKLFILFAVIFFGAVAYLGYDISSRTTFPGSKPQLQERLMNDQKDTTQIDTLINKAPVLK
jgi:hypothetical protein